MLTRAFLVLSAGAAILGAQSTWAGGRRKTDTMLVIVLLALVSFGGSVAAQSEATMERGLVHDLQAVFKQGRMLIFRLRSAVRALENQTDALDSVESTVKAALGRV